MDAGILAVLLIFGTIFAAVIGIIVLIGLKILQGSTSREIQKRQVEETKLIQELYQGLARMEERVEALETLLLERERKENYR